MSYRPGRLLDADVGLVVPRFVTYRCTPKHQYATTQQAQLMHQVRHIEVVFCRALLEHGPCIDGEWQPDVFDTTWDRVIVAARWECGNTGHGFVYASPDDNRMAVHPVEGYPIFRDLCRRCQAKVDARTCQALEGTL